MARYALEGSEGATTSLFSVEINGWKSIHSCFGESLPRKMPTPLGCVGFSRIFFSTGTNVRSRKPKKGKLDREPDVRKLLDPTTMVACVDRPDEFVRRACPGSYKRKLII